MLKQKFITILKSMRSDYPCVLSDEKMFKALARDLFENNPQYNAAIRYLCIALFEYDALSLLKSDIDGGESFASNNLLNKLVGEGARHDLAAEVTGYLLVLLGQDEKTAAKFLNDSVSSSSVSVPMTSVSFGGRDWLVLEEKDDCSLLLSERVLEKRAYNNADTDVAWESCTLREYLNTRFIKKFSKEEQGQIMPYETHNTDNPWFETNGGGSTTDKIFLLSLDEVVKYFGDSGQLHNPPAMKMWLSDPGYNKSRIARDHRDIAAVWWLRSPGNTNRSAAAVMGNGFITPAGFAVSNDEGGVRPAMWVKIPALSNRMPDP